MVSAFPLKAIRTIPQRERLKHWEWEGGASSKNLVGRSKSKCLPQTGSSSFWPGISKHNSRSAALSACLLCKIFSASAAPSTTLYHVHSPAILHLYGHMDMRSGKTVMIFEPSKRTGILMERHPEASLTQFTYRGFGDLNAAQRCPSKQ